MYRHILVATDGSALSTPAIRIAERIPARHREASQARACRVQCRGTLARRGGDGFILGSETTKVLTHSKIPVLVCR